MLRSTLIAAGVAVLCSASFAQQTLDASKVFPITSPVKNAGTFNVNTKRWMSPSKTPTQNGVIQVIYDNRCTWSGGNFYTGTGSCETYIDAGEIPGSANLTFAAAGTQEVNKLYLKLGEHAWWSFQALLDRPSVAAVNKQKRALTRGRSKAVSTPSLKAIAPRLLVSEGRALRRAARAIWARVGEPAEIK